MVQSIIALQSQQNFPGKHLKGVSRRNSEIRDIVRSAGEQDAEHHLGGKDGARVRKDRIAAEVSIVPESFSYLVKEPH